MFHAGLPEILVAAQKLSVDGSDLVERRAQPAEIVEETRQPRHARPLTHRSADAAVRWR
jgi:hypothetical protein